MADEFQSGICGGNRWNNTSRSSFGTTPSMCSAVMLSDMGSYGWSTEDMTMDMKTTRSTNSDEDDDRHSASVVCDNSMGFQDIIHKPHPVDSGGVLLDSTLHMLGFGLSPSSVTSDWNNHSLLHGSERSESNYNSMLQQEAMNSPRMNYRQEDQRRSSVNNNSHQFPQTDWTSKNFDDSTVVVTSCQGLPTGSFPPMGSSNSYHDYPSSIVQSLFEPDDHDHHHQPHQTVFDNNYHSSSSPNFNRITSNNDHQFIPSSLPKLLSPNFLKPSSTPKQQLSAAANNHLQFSNNTHFWNASSSPAAAAAVNNNDIRASFLSSQHSQFGNPTFEDKPNFANQTAKPNNSELQVSMAKKSSNEPAFKRPRIETPSPLPTFKVRKEKLGDRITALQQLVSPFGKTDTASVLHEAIEYIKFLHDQVSVLSTPYMKNGAVHNVQHQQTSHKLKDSEETKQDLRSRGLCLVPISSTYPVANETTADFWTPTFGGTFR